jgi:hypothetical protein
VKCIIFMPIVSTNGLIILQLALCADIKSLPADSS